MGRSAHCGNCATSNRRTRDASVSTSPTCILPAVISTFRGRLICPLSTGTAQPLIHISLCPDKPILAGSLGSFARCPLPMFAGRHDDEDVICLTCYPVNNQTPAMQ